ncbi:MAG: secondary thiamine-phosphate synthase enzyme YjbQ [Chitinophagales bacterium]
MIQQTEFTLPAYKRGFHLITEGITKHLPDLPQTGILVLFIKHTSAGLTINENADPSVRVDFETSFNKLAPENAPYYTHNDEGPDDMPAHIKTALVGYTVTVPITNHRLNLGTWQGLYLCEFRNHARGRTIVATVYS